MILIYHFSPMDFARPVSFENADIGLCPDSAVPHEKEEEGEVSHPEPDTEEKKASAASTPLPPFPPLPVSELFSPPAAHTCAL